MSLPTRAYAAALVSLGAASAAYQDPEKRDGRAHFEELCRLPQGTGIRFPEGKYLKCANLVGREERDGTEYLAYKDDSIKYIKPWDRCRAVAPLEPGEKFVRRRLLATNADFVRAVLGVDPLAHASHTSHDCLVVSVKTALREELVEHKFSVELAGGKVTDGVLNDLLRCDAYELNANDHDRTTLISPFIDEVPEQLVTDAPPAVVFDGPAGYLRLRSKWRRSNQILLVDRSSPSSESAGAAFDQEFAMSPGDVDLSPLGPAPAEIEVCGFYEAVR